MHKKISARGLNKKLTLKTNRNSSFYIAVNLKKYNQTYLHIAKIILKFNKNI
jgi:hypothetical protein